jgi:hypothetical protein
MNVYAEIPVQISRLLAIIIALDYQSLSGT